MQNIASKSDINPPVSIDQQGINWVQSTLDNMTLDEKIGQLIHVAAWSNKSESHTQEIEEIIIKHKIGGLIFFQGNPKSQAKLTNQYQSISNVPLMLSIDAEWGLGMRLDEVESFPYQMTLGALQTNELIYEMGKVVGKQLKRIGINLNHAPVVDVNTNPKNPVIGFRSFGQDKLQVVKKSSAYMLGLHDEGILACAKHFPGHGDTSIDSHVDLPMLNKSKEELKKTELFPYKKLIEEGLGAVMTAHLYLPKIDDEKNNASTLSKVIIDDILKNEMDFKGLVLTDALDMKAVTDYFPNGTLEVKALKAGNDILLFVKDVEIAISEIKLAVIKGELRNEDINERCYKQLVYKYSMGLTNFTPILIDNIVDDINEFTPAINEQIYAKSITLLKKEIPFPTIESKTLLVSVFAKGDKPDEGSLNHHTILKNVLGDGDIPVFEKIMDEYFNQCTQISINESQIDAFDKARIESFASYDQLIVSVHNVKIKAKDNFGFSAKMLELIDSIISSNNTHLVFFGSAYALAKISNLKSASSILLAYQENKYTHNCASQILKNEIAALGKLPVSINKEFMVGEGITN